MRRETIRIGTSGYDDPTWSGTFYPRDLPQRQRLEYYARHFDTVELNFSYYRLPTYQGLKSMTAWVPERFAFFIKAYRTMTHFTVEQPSPEQFQTDCAQFREALGGLGSQLRGVLFQFPYSFRYSTANLETMGNLLLDFREFTPVVEFRHDSWLNYAVSDFLKTHRIPFCCVDEPQLPNLIPPIVRSFGDISYVRFHGRNKTRWYGESKLRYDYDYSSGELFEWEKRIDYLSEYSDETFVFFNNCHQGKAVKNAKMMAEALGLT